MAIRRNLVCNVCGHADFVERRGLLNRIMWSGLGRMFNNQRAQFLICKRCGYIHMFES